MADSTQTALETLGAAVTDLVNAVGGAIDTFDATAIKRSESTPDGLALLGATRDVQQDLIANEQIALAVIQQATVTARISTKLIEVMQ